jgi:hypothetical protein
MDTERREAEARARAEAKYLFYRHFLVFGGVMLLLLGINLAFSAGTLWVVWPFLGWGIAVAAHGVGVFALGGRRAVVDRMTARELRKTP